MGSDAKLPTITVDDVPTVAREKLGDALGVDLGADFGTFTIYDEGKLSTAQQVVSIFDKVVVALHDPGHRSRSSVPWPSRSAAGGPCSSSLGRGGGGLHPHPPDRASCSRTTSTHVVKVAVNRPAATVVVSTFADPLTDGAARSLWVIGIVAFIAILTGPYQWVRVAARLASPGLFRSATTAVSDRANDDATLQWVARNVDALRIGGYVVGALLLWFVEPHVAHVLPDRPARRRLAGAGGPARRAGPRPVDGARRRRRRTAASPPASPTTGDPVAS